MKIKHKIIMLPTLGKSNIYKVNNDLFCYIPGVEREPLNCENYHLYLVSDEEIKEGDWHWNSDDNSIRQAKLNLGIKAPKIIATTDKSIRNTHQIIDKEENINYPYIEPLPQIPESFIKYFVEKQGKVDSVEVEYEEIKGRWITPVGMYGPGYYADSRFELKLTSNNEVIITIPEEKLYTREEVIKLCHKMNNRSYSYTQFDKWIEDNLK